mgnify:CR=1 FL=1
MTRKVRTRFAPSPTGPLHMGGVRTALYCYLFTKKMKGDFLLRIEDTDQGRFVPGAEEYIIEALNWVGISPSEGQSIGGDFGPYRQSERKHLYKQYADLLVEKGHAYYVFTSDDNWAELRESLIAQGKPSPKYDNVNRQYLKNSLTLPADEVQKRLAAGEEYAIRYKMPRNEEVKFKDIIRDVVSFQTNQLDDKVLMKSDGMPTYHLANVVDDHLMEITHVVRGEEWLPSTPLHVLLYKSFEWEMPEFAHLPLILKPDGKGKLSKRDGDRLGFPVFPIDWTNPETGEESKGFRERGFMPEAFLNMLAFLGWNPGTEQEIFSIEQLTQKFNFERVNKAGAKFNLDKTKWFQQQYMQTKDDADLAELFKPILLEKGIQKTNEEIQKIVSFVKERAVFIDDFWGLAAFFFETPLEYDEKSVKKGWKEGSSDLMQELITVVSNIEDFSSKNTEKEIKEWISSKEIGYSKVMQPLRLSLVGKLAGPHLFDIIAMIGKEETIKRLENAIKNL